MSWRKSIDKNDLHPALVKVMDLTLEKLEKGGTPFKIYSGLRTFMEQERLYAKGRTAPGRIVTKAKGGQSMHNYGLAVDLAPLNLQTEKEGDVHWPAPDKNLGIWLVLERALLEATQEFVGESEFEWGGRWKFRDVPHCQIRITLRELKSGYYPYVEDVNWEVHAHQTFLYDNAPWMKRRVQYLLNKSGYNVGGVDGVIGPRTLEALRNFQRDVGLACSGEIWIHTVAELVKANHRLSNIS